MENGEQRQADSSQAALDWLTDVLRSHQEIAAVIKQAAVDSTPTLRKQSLSLSRWFEQPVTPRQVLLRADALSICLRLRRSSGADQSESVPRWQIEDAVHQDLAATSSPLPQNRNLITLLAYPVVLLMFCGFLLIGICLFLIPQFEQMHNEFGLTLPPATKFVFALSHLIRQWGLVLLGLMLLAAVIVYFVGRWRDGTEFSWSSRWNKFRTGRRGASADWAWHVSLLLDAGLSQTDAIAIAGDASCKHWMRRISATWADQLRRGLQPFDTLTRLSGRPCHLLAQALKLDNAADQSALLREVAAIYWERDQLRSRWWLAWLSPATVCFVGFVVGLIVVALFMPMIELISGLT
jgi:type II secretory pathway component PulF